jgi:DNA-binding IclR family transcriptional regulator
MVPADPPPRRLADSKLARGIALLHTFRPGDTELMLKQLTARAGLAAGTAHRLSRELAELGMLDRVPGGFRPGWAVARLALRATTWPDLDAAAGPAAERLHALSGCPVTLHLSAGGGLLPMWRLASRQGVTERRAVPGGGDLSPLLPELARRGAVEHKAGGRPALLAAVRNGAGDLVAALEMAADSCGQLYRFGPALLAAARETGRAIPPLPATAPPAPSGATGGAAHEAPGRAAGGAPAATAGAGVLARGIGLLSCLRPGERAVRRLDVVERAVTPRSTAYRCLDELLRGGVLADHDGMLGLGPLPRRLAAAAVAPRLPFDERLRALAEAGACWLTPVDPDHGVPLNGLVMRPLHAEPGTAAARRREWDLVTRAVAAAMRGRRAARTPGDPYALTVTLRLVGLPACLTVVAGPARLPLAEHLLREYAGPSALSA